jgi:hypothetical protein
LRYHSSTFSSFMKSESHRGRRREAKKEIKKVRLELERMVKFFGIK